MGVKENCDQWIDFVCSDWLQWMRTRKKDSYLRESTRNMVSRMKDASREPSRREEAWNLLERLKRIGNTISSLDDDSSIVSYRYEQSEIYLECALAAYRMGDLQEALVLFNTPIGSFPNRSLYKAISCWFCGCIHWQFQSHLEDALVFWEKSLHIIREVESDNSNNFLLVSKCREIKKNVTDAINDASKNNFPPPPPRRTGSPRPSTNYQPSILRTFPVIGAIPAGTPVGILPPEEDALAVEVVELSNGKCYKMVSLRGENLIRLSQSKFYYVLGVEGDSMNMAVPVKIEDGDYVLMAKQDEAVNGDIVAAEILDVDQLATLKRYRLESGKSILIPESDNPDFQKPIATPKGFIIRGIALAVLKPENEAVAS